MVKEVEQGLETFWKDSTYSDYCRDRARYTRQKWFLSRLDLRLIRNESGVSTVAECKLLWKGSWKLPTNLFWPNLADVSRDVTWDQIAFLFSDQSSGFVKENYHSGPWPILLIYTSLQVCREHLQGALSGWQQTGALPTGRDCFLQFGERGDVHTWRLRQDPWRHHQEHW